MPARPYGTQLPVDSLSQHFVLGYQRIVPSGLGYTLL
jgi:hypothetical protein